MSDLTAKQMAAREITSTTAFGKFHVIDNALVTACGRVGSVHTRLAQSVPVDERCKRPGCKQNWPDYRAEGDARVWR